MDLRAQELPKVQDPGSQYQSTGLWRNSGTRVQPMHGSKATPGTKRTGHPHLSSKGQGRSDGVAMPRREGRPTVLPGEPARPPQEAKGTRDIEIKKEGEAQRINLLNLSFLT